MRFACLSLFFQLANVVDSNYHLTMFDDQDRAGTMIGVV